MRAVLAFAVLGCSDKNEHSGVGDSRAPGDDTAAIVDADGDGFSPPEDCNDADDAIHPGAPEICDGRDNDCDGEDDGPDAIDAVTYWADADGDGYGAGSPERACFAPIAASDNDLDCDDTRADVNPAAVDVCDGVDIDEDCDGTRDQGCALAPFNLSDADLIVLGRARARVRLDDGLR